LFTLGRCFSYRCRCGIAHHRDLRTRQISACILVRAPIAVRPTLGAPFCARFAALGRRRAFTLLGALAAAAFTAVAAFTTLCSTRGSLGPWFGRWRILPLHIHGGARRARIACHWFAFSVETLACALPGALRTTTPAAATIAPATATATALWTATLAAAFTTWFTATGAVPAGTTLALVFLGGFLLRLGHGCSHRRRYKQLLQPAKEALFCRRRPGHGRLGHRVRCSCHGLGQLRLGNRDRRWRIRQHALDDRGLLVGWLL
jgi:hypothetical protein